MLSNRTLPISFFVLLLLLAVACTPKAPDNPVKRFPLLPMPLEVHLNGGGIMSGYETQANADTFWFPPGTQVWGMLSDTSDAYHILTLPGKTDYPEPIYSRFTKQGRKVKALRLGLGGCSSSECGYDCKEWLRINPDFTYKAWVIATQATCEGDSVLESESVTTDTVDFGGPL